ncbi:ST3 beta-galactoside alpha-2,3-sialyltransferase 7 isoform X2 [Takifugu flavidus]|uniref:ST3 beta-galactoside alpha-2,3-sialyltransferase 7 isoform X2 n=1 Tax=Takifugu flavidus TaxID=433684 RepID=UPI0025448237|nr:ST3 beta-galactoside alpha-2,3-sialyltransferase 7 isoform X2 [Takifugu flavidus]
MVNQCSWGSWKCSAAILAALDRLQTQVTAADCGIPAAMVTMSVEDPGDDSPLLPEAVEAGTPGRLAHRQPITKPGSWDFFFLSRSQNLALGAALLFGCYSAVLIPAYFPLKKAIFNDPRPKNLVLFNRSASLLLDPCRPRWCLNRLKRLPCSEGLLDIPVFVQQDVPSSWDLPPPLGLRGSEEHLALALASLPQLGLPPSLRGEGGCRRCVVVGNGGVLHGSHLGAHIDQYDVIIRMNNAPVSGFERDAGSRTTVRLLYPEGAPHSGNEYRETTTVALVVFKSLDLDWLISVVTRRPLGFWSKLWFWREVVEDIPLTRESFRILHPEIIRRTGRVLQRYTLTRGKMVPTLGASAVVMALQVCDQVVHDIGAEKLFLRDLVAAGATTDLTGAL